MSSPRRLTAVAATLIVAQLIVRSWIVARGDFYWDDLILIGRASSAPILSWDLLGEPHDGHFMPGAFLVAGLTTLVAPLQWWLPAATLVVLQAIASVAVWHMIRTIAPRARGGALAAFAFYLFVPMTVTAFAWWAAGLNTLPMQAACAFVVAAAVRLVRDRPGPVASKRLVAAATAAFLIGLLFFEKSLFILPVAFAAALLAAREPERGDETADYRSSALTTTFVRARALWTTLGAVFVGWTILYFATSDPVDGSHSLGQAMHLVWRSIDNAMIPSLVGGPWVWDRWIPSPPMGIAPVWMIVLGWLLLIGLIVGTVRAKRGAAAIWVCAIGYAVAAQIPVMWNRASADTALELAQTLRYLPDTALVLTIAFALIAAAPRAGGSHAADRAPDRRWQAAGAVGAVLLAVSAMIGTSAFTESWRDNPTGAYVANAREALQSHPDAVMFDQPLPLDVLLPVAYPYNQISRLFGRLPDRASFGSVTDSLIVLDPNGRAVPGAVTPHRRIEATDGSCRRPQIRGPHRLRLDGPLFAVRWTVQLGYCADRDGDIELRLDGGDPVRVPVKAGLHTVYAQLDGGGDGLQIRPVTPGLRLHTGEGRVGVPTLAGLVP